MNAQAQNKLQDSANKPMSSKAACKTLKEAHNSRKNKTKQKKPRTDPEQIILSVDPALQFALPD